MLGQRPPHYLRKAASVIDRIYLHNRLPLKPKAKAFLNSYLLIAPQLDYSGRAASARTHAKLAGHPRNGCLASPFFDRVA